MTFEYSIPCDCDERVYVCFKCFGEKRIGPLSKYEYDAYYENVAKEQEAEVASKCGN